MKSLALIVFLAVAITLNTQTQPSNKHFSGALELGTGWGHVIDFTLANNILSSKCPVEEQEALT